MEREKFLRGMLDHCYKNKDRKGVKNLWRV